MKSWRMMTLGDWRSCFKGGDFCHLFIFKWGEGSKAIRFHYGLLAFMLGPCKAQGHKVFYGVFLPRHFQRSLNVSFLFFIPKKGVKGLKNFRPISLAKVLTNKLKKKLWEKSFSLSTCFYGGQTDY